MTKIYLILSIISIVVLSYFYGANVANAKCKLLFAQQQSAFLQKSQEQYLENKRLIDEKVYKTGVVDIRGILFNKYTISE